MKIAKGSTRTVWLIGRCAIKFPTLYSWTKFLMGIIANIEEYKFYKYAKNENKADKLAPVLFRFPLGLFIIMPRCKPLTQEQWDAFDCESFCNMRIVEVEGVMFDLHIHDNEFIYPMEAKKNSFGIYKNKIVGIDYGN